MDNKFSNPTANPTGDVHFEIVCAGDQGYLSGVYCPIFLSVSPRSFTDIYPIAKQHVGR